MKIPQTILTAVHLNYWRLGIGAIIAFLQLGVDPRTKNISNSVAILVVLMLITSSLTIFLLVQTKARKNWARITFLVLFCIGVAHSITNYTYLFKELPLFAFANLGLEALKIYSLSLMFGSEANAWFSGKIQNENGA